MTRHTNGYFSIRLLRVLLFSLNLIVACSRKAPTFDYVIHVIDRDTGNNIPNATVTIEVPGMVPFDAVTDDKGLVTIPILTTYAEQSGRILVEKQGYNPYRQEVNLIPNSLPDIINLVQSNVSVAPTPIPSATIASIPTVFSTITLPTLTPTTENTVIPTAVSTSTPTAENTAIPTAISTSTPIPTETRPYYCATVGTTFQDDFSHKGSGWVTYEISDGFARYDAGQYVIALFKGNRIIPVEHGGQECYHDFDMQVQVARIDSNNGGYAAIRFGIVSGDYYEVRLYTVGAPGLRVLHISSGGIETIGPTIIGANQINTGSNPNTVRVILHNNQIEIILNNESVYSSGFNEVRWGEIRLVGCTCDMDVDELVFGDAIYHFDNFSIESLN